MNKLGFKTKAFYGLAGVGDSALYTMMETFELFFLTTVAGVNPAAAGVIAAIGSVWETICGALVGYSSDNTHTKYGKRKPYLMAASVPLLLFTSLFFININAGDAVMAVYYGAMVVLFWTSFSVFYVPYLAWGAELTDDYDERTVIRGYVFFFNTIGTLIGMVMPNVLIGTLTSSGVSLDTSWMAMGIIAGAISGATIFIGAAGIKTASNALDERGVRNAEKRTGSMLASLVDLLKNYLELLKLRTVRCILGASIFYLMGYAVFCSDRMYFFTYNMGMPNWAITLVLLVMTFASVVFVPFISLANKWVDKRTTYIVGMLIDVAGMIIYGLVGVSSLLDVCIFSILYCVGNICYWQLMPAMLYDVCEADQLTSGKHRAGLVVSLQSLSESAANALGLLTLGLILSFAGFNGSADVQAATTLRWTSLSFSIIPAVLMAFSALCIFRYPITKGMYEKILAGIRRREEGETVDMEEFKKL